MAEESLESILAAARKLPPDEQRRLAEQFIEQLEEKNEQNKKKRIKAKATSNRTRRALEAVEKTRGSMKGLDRDTIIWLAEDEELCGY